jgi:NTP pyrophosphatase (non-canonical NTP hydrolase)
MVMSYFSYTQQDVATAVKEARAAYLEDLAMEAYQVAASKGWEKDGDTRTFGDECTLLHSEISEAFEAFRRRGFESWEGPGGKPEGVGSEFADIFIRLLHYCHTRRINLQAEYDRKTAYNRTREYRHGNKAL